MQLVAYFQDFQLTWSYFFDQLVAGLTLGSLYGLIAIGYSMVYGILKLLNFAHGEVFMIGSYIGFFVLTALGGAADPKIPVAATILVMFLAAMLGAGALGVVIERFAYRPLRQKRASRIAPLISALGVSFFLQQLAVILFGSIPKQYNSFAFDNGSLFTSVDIGPFTIQYMQLFVIVTTVVLMAALTVFIARTIRRSTSIPPLGRAKSCLAFSRVTRSASTTIPTCRPSLSRNAARAATS